MDGRCPNCGLINPPGAARCDCGYDFAAAAVPPTPAERQAEAEALASKARASWLCPVAAWASQIVLHLTLRGVPGLGPLWTLAMVVQFALIVGGLYLGAKVLSRGRQWATLAPGTRAAAIAGVLLSGGTILLIVVLSLRDTFR